MNKLAFLDIGELSWSLYLSAHIRWLKKNTDSMIVVISLSERKCLYADLVDDIIDIPEAFYKKYDLKMQDSLKLRHVNWSELRTFFSPYVPEGYRIPDCNEHPGHIINNKKFIYMPYKYLKPPKDDKEIIIFPRYRSGLWARRNLPESFYLHLIKQLCDEFSELTVRTSGIKSGAYDIKIDKPNYINWVGKENGGLQDLIDNCQSAVAAIGGVSAPPKISLLQGVPTFIIGHEKKRYIQRENWMNTKIGFYEIGKREYAKINIDDCTRAAIAFVEESHDE